MSAELQDLVDDLASDLGRPISVEDRRWRLVAFSAQRGEVDPVRRSSIMSRSAPPKVIEFLESQQLGVSEGLVHLAAIDLGMQPRTCLALRSHDLLLGFLWVIDGDEPLCSAETARLTEAGEAVAEALWEDRMRNDVRRRRRAEIVEQLLSAHDAHKATAALATDLGWPVDGPYVAALGTGPDDDVGDHARRRWPHGELLAGQWRGHPLVVARVQGAATARELVNVLHASGAQLAAVGGVVGSLPEIGDSVDQATLALRIARATGRDDPTVCFEELDSGWRLIARLWVTAGEPEPPASILALESHGQAGELLETLEVMLDSDGDVTAAAGELHMHRATLYRRLERIEEITGLTLSASDDRLLAHLGLRLRRLARAPDAFGDSHHD